MQNPVGTRVPRVRRQGVRECPLWLNREHGTPRFSNPRDKEMSGILASVAGEIREADDVPIVIGGDFNGYCEPHEKAKLRPVASETFHATWHQPFECKGKRYGSYPSDHGFILTTFELELPAPPARRFRTKNREVCNCFCQLFRLFSISNDSDQILF